MGLLHLFRIIPSSLINRVIVILFPKKKKKRKGDFEVNSIQVVGKQILKLLLKGIY